MISSSPRRLVDQEHKYRTALSLWITLDREMVVKFTSLRITEKSLVVTKIKIIKSVLHISV